MKTQIEVSDRKEARLIRAGLARADVRAFVKVIGALDALPSNRARIRALRFVADKLDEEAPA